MLNKDAQTAQNTSRSQTYNVILLSQTSALISAHKGDKGAETAQKIKKIKRNKEEQIKERLERGRAIREEGNNRESKHNNIPK